MGSSFCATTDVAQKPEPNQALFCTGVQIKAELKSEPDFKMAEPQLDFGILESKDSDAVPLGLCPNPCVTGSVAAAGLTVAVADVQSQGLGVVEAPAEDIGHDTFDRLNCEGFDALDDMVWLSCRQ